jgi:hypothetical protein
MRMHQIDDAIVRGGRLELSHLPFPDGQRVRILVTEVESQAGNRNSIHEIRRLLKGGVERFDDPFGPMIPPEHWEMLK